MDCLVNAICTLINNGKTRQARHVAESYLNFNCHALEDAYFWFLYGQTVRLTDKNDKLVLTLIEKNMSKCKNFTVQVRSDWLCVEAQDAILQRDPDTAKEILYKRMPTLNITDTNHIAIINMTKGRLAYLRNRLDLALYYHSQAEILWEVEPKIRFRQYKLDNLFYKLKSMSSRGIDHHDVADKIVKESRNRIIRWRTRLISCGRLGNFIDDILVRFLFY